MDLYQNGQPQLLQDQSLTSQQDETFQTPQILPLENHSKHPKHCLPSVRKFLSQPNPLMNKIQFTPYHPKCYYPRQLIKLPKCLRDFSCIMTEKNNMNLLSEAMHAHNKLRKDVGEALACNGKRRDQNQKTNLLTLDEYYAEKIPIYQRYTEQEMKLEEMKLKLKYFATYVLDMAKVLRKQIKLQEKQQKQQKQHLNTQANTTQLRQQLINRPASVAKSGNFSIRQRKTSTPITHLADISSTQRISNLQKNLPANQSKKSLHHSRIQFESNFESGNLFRVYQKQPNQYDLILQNDINTKGNTQWFFFSVRNVSKNSVLKFNIVNLSKSSSLFSIGMKPYVFSMMRYQKRKVGWLREALKVSYEESQFLRKQSSKRPYYVLSFQYKFLYQGDVLYFSHSIPYTLTDLSHFLSLQLKDKTMHKLVKYKNVGLTLGSNEVDVLEITNSEVLNRNRKAVWILARQHPGETTSGFMLEGIIDFLLSSTEQSRNLLNNFVFKIVPMVNVDGVVHGNSRAQFIGHDPNRRWSSPHKLHNPIVHSLKHYIERDKDNIEMVVDLHSHSRKLGTFFYGNTVTTNTAATRIFPLMVCKNDVRFSYKSCRFSGGSNNAARYALFEALRIPLIYTVESSFYGYHQGDFKIVQYLPSDYKEMGASLMKGFLNYEVKKNHRTLKLLAPPRPIDLRQQTQYPEIDDQQFQKSSVGSDQDPAQDQYNEKQFKKLITIKEKKKKKKKAIKQPEIKVIKEKQQEPKKQPKPKVNNSESHYKEYFSGKPTCAYKKSNDDTVINTTTNIPNKKPSVSIAIQVNIRQHIPPPTKRDSSQVLSSRGFADNNVITERNTPQQQMIYSKLAGFSVAKPFMPNNLCVIGQKVEEISVYGTTVGVQVSENKEIFASRMDPNINFGRRTFGVRQRINSFLQVKENNFLQRGDCMTKNFFSRR